MFNMIDRLEKHLESGAFTREAIRSLFSNVEIPDEAFEDPKAFCEKMRRDPFAYISPDPDNRF